VIPDLPVVQRPRLRSLAGRYAFDPFSLITFASPEPPGEDEHAFIADNLKYHAAQTHESHHWIQWQGTTVGAFLTALRHSSEQAVFLIERLPASDRRRLSSERTSSAPRPIVKLAGDQSLLAESARDSQPLGSLVQTWYDHLVLHKMFLDSSAMAEIPWDMSTAFAESLADVMELLHRVGVVEDYDYLSARAAFSLPESSHAVLAIAGEHLTTSAILETAATVNEMLALVALKDIMSPPHREAALSDIALRLSTGTYGLARELFGRTVPRLVGTRLSPWTLNLICDIALNPPLPPVVASLAPVDWADVYPPFRFARACIALERVGRGVDVTSTHGDYVELISDVCSEAGLSDPTQYRPRLAAHQRLDWLAACDLAPGQLPADAGIASEHSYFDYLLWGAQKFWSLRHEDLSFVINSGWRSTRGDRFELLLDREGAGWFRPPLWALGDRFGYTESIGVPFGSWLATSAAGHAAAHEFMLDTALGLASLPVQLREKIHGVVVQQYEGLLAAHP
jgi:hypothetical protein